MPTGDYKISKVTDPADPRRCQAITSRDQCMNTVVEGSKFCAVHGGNKAVEKAKKKSMGNYHLGKWQAKAASKAGSSAIKSLRDEVAILRMILEERFGAIPDTHELLLQSGPISEMVMKIDRVVNSMHKLQLSSGDLLDKTILMQFATNVVQVIGELVTDEDIVKEIADRIIALLAEEEDD